MHAYNFDGWSFQGGILHLKHIQRGRSRPTSAFWAMIWRMMGWTQQMDWSGKVSFLYIYTHTHTLSLYLSFSPSFSLFFSLSFSPFLPNLISLIFSCLCICLWCYLSLDKIYIIKIYIIINRCFHNYLFALLKKLIILYILVIKHPLSSSILDIYLPNIYSLIIYLFIPSFIFLGIPSSFLSSVIHTKLNVVLILYIYQFLFAWIQPRYDVSIFKPVHFSISI